MSGFDQYIENLELKISSLRKEVLYILWSAERPLKAYEILAILLEKKPNATPPTVYRSLSFFLTLGIAHKIESIQSYTLCCEPTKNFALEVLMVCHTCHNVVEIYDDVLRHLISNLAKKKSFQLHNHAIELQGMCGVCQERCRLTPKIFS